MKDLKNKTYTAVVWDLIGKIADQGLGFVISIFLARLLTPAEFGLVAMVMVVITIAHSLIDMGLGTALIQRKEVKDAHYGSVFFFNIFIGTILTVALYFSATWFATFYENPDIKPIFQALSFIFLINSFSNVQRSWLTKNIRYKTLTQSRIFSVLIGGPLGLWMAFNGYGVWSLVAQSLASGISANVFIYFFTGWKPKWIFSINALKELWSYGFKMFLSGMISTISEQMDNLIIGKAFNAQSLGLYNRAKSFNLVIIKYTSAPLMSVLFPVLSSIQNDDERFKKIVFKSFHVLNLVTFILLGVLFFTIEDLVIVLFTEKWLPSVIYFKIMLLGGYGYPFSALLVNIISSKGNSSIFLKLELYKRFLVFNLLAFGFYFGIEGFLYLKVIVTFINVYLNIYFASKEIKVNVLWFYKIITPYFLNVIFVISTLIALEKFIRFENPFFHSFFITFIFVSLYLLIAFSFKMKAFIFIKEELLEFIKKRKSK